MNVYLGTVDFVEAELNKLIQVDTGRQLELG